VWCLLNKNAYFCSMLQFENQKIKQIVRKVLPVVTLGAMLYSCASIGRPDGGPYDETPPRFIGSTPAAGALNNERTKISLMFDEFIKLEKATEKVVVSPPQIQQPEIKASGKRIQVNLLDSLKPNTTYTIDFSDAIVDNKKKKKKKGEEDEPEPTKFLPVNVGAPSSMDVYGSISLSFEEPIASFDTAAIHLRQKVDTLWKDIPFDFEQDSVNLKRFNLYYDWEPTLEYEFSVDSTAFHGIYGLFTDKIKQGFKVRSLEEYAKITFVVTGAEPNAFVELLDAQDKSVCLSGFTSLATFISFHYSFSFVPL
jgi:hypothetical protein